jgi:serine/threonine protein kinase
MHALPFYPFSKNSGPISRHSLSKNTADLEFFAEGKEKVVWLNKNDKNHVYLTAKKGREKNLRKEWEQIQTLQKIDGAAQYLAIDVKRIDNVNGKFTLRTTKASGNLKGLIQAPLKLDQKVKYAYQLAKGLRILHQNRLFHGDVKLDNVLVFDGQLKISDFGKTREFVKRKWYSGNHTVAAPETVASGHLTDKSEVFGLALSLIQIFEGNTSLMKKITDHRCIGICGCGRSFAKTLCRLIGLIRGLFFNYVRPSRTCKIVSDHIDQLDVDKEIKDLLKSMTQLKPVDRPNMESVAAKLDAIYKKIV